jgi:hypothetical protein
MNDLAVPFFTVFLSPYCGDNADAIDLSEVPPDVLNQVEADCYWCTAILIDRIQVGVASTARLVFANPPGQHCSSRVCQPNAVISV